MSTDQELEAYINEQREAAAEQDANERTAATLALIDAIEAFVSIKMANGRLYFWDDLKASGNFAEFLVSNGWRKP